MPNGTNFLSSDSRTDKEEFLAIVSHELKKPMSDVKGYLSAILDGDAGEISEDVKDYVAKAYTANDYLIRLVERMIKVGHFKSGKIQPKLEKTNLTKQVQVIVSDFHIPAFEKGQNLVFEAPKEDLFAMADQDLFWEIVINLISNAIKFTPKGGKIYARCYLQGSNVITEVEDTGMGIKKDDQKHLFEMFSDIGASLGNNETGTGLGLYLSKKLADVQGGRLFLKSSTPGKGTIFCLSLPKSP